MKKAASQNANEHSLHSSAAQARPPIVVVMGHVDHGKTTLLDHIRQSRVAEREAGGITQSIGAYEIEKNGQRITFIDTPGHQAFTKMRQRGAQVADIAILIVAADDGVQPQTKEAITILQESKTPFVVAINKVDRNNADPERTKQSLMTNGVYLEKYGGDVSWVEISAKNGTGIDELLDLVLLMWEVEKPEYDPNAQARGFVLESQRDSRRGIVASVIVKDGTLRMGDEIHTVSASGKVRTLENFLGKRIDSAIPSSPALILGFSDLPVVGEEFVTGPLGVSGEVAPAPAKQDKKVCEVQRVEACDDSGNTIRLVLKADVSGSLEALSQIIESLAFEDVRFRILAREVGEVTDGDVKEASTLKAYIIGFNVKVAKAAESLARAQNVSIITSNIIYRLIENLEELAASSDKKKELGALEVLAVFSQKNNKQLIGGKMVQGFLTLNERFTVVRQEEQIGQGRILNLQQSKADCSKVECGECGLMVESRTAIQAGDQLIVEKK
jgi:translation initiation factor IF-2